MRRLWRFVLLVQAFSVFIVMQWPPGSAAGAPPGTPELRLSLHEGIQATIDNNANVRLLKERIVAAQSAASTSLGALLPNVSGFVSGSNQTVNLAAFGFPPDRLSGLGLQRPVPNRLMSTTHGPTSCRTFSA